MINTLVASSVTVSVSDVNSAPIIVFTLNDAIGLKGDITTLSLPKGTCVNVTPLCSTTCLPLYSAPARLLDPVPEPILIPPKGAQTVPSHLNSVPEEPFAITKEYLGMEDVVPCPWVSVNILAAVPSPVMLAFNFPKSASPFM